MGSESDRLLIKSIRHGDERAWEQLIHRFEGRILAYAIRKLRDRSLAEDVVQETLIGFLNSLPNYDDNRDLQNYLFSIASYKITDQIRKKNRHYVEQGEGAEIHLAEKADSQQRGASSIARNREQQELEGRILARALHHYIDPLRKKKDYLRIQVLELLYVKGLPNRQVAKMLGISEQQIANYRFSFVKKITETVKENGLINNQIIPFQES